MRKSLLIGILLITCACLMFIFDGGVNPVWFLNGPAALFLFTIVTAGLLFTYTLSFLIETFKNIFAPRRKFVSPEELALAVGMLRQASDLSIASMKLATLGGLIVYLRNVTEPQVVGHVLAFVVASCLYSTLLAEFFFRSLIERTISTASDQARENVDTIDCGDDARRNFYFCIVLIVLLVFFAVFPHAPTEQDDAPDRLSANDSSPYDRRFDEAWRASNMRVRTVCP